MWPFKKKMKQEEVGPEIAVEPTNEESPEEIGFEVCPFCGRKQDIKQ